MKQQRLCLAIVAIVVSLPTVLMADQREGRGSDTALPGVSSKVHETGGIANLVEVNDRILSGGTPSGDDAFRILAERGVTTIVSVDGARPDVDRATRFGLRYIHLPISYGAISKERIRSLTKAVSLSEGRVYIHCHHGKHRAPAAAACAAKSLGLLNDGDAAVYLKKAGTDPRYRGLIRSVENAVPLTAEELQQIPVDFASASDATGLSAVMVRMESAFEAASLSAVEKRGELASHTARAEAALLLLEELKEMRRDNNSAHQFIDDNRDLLSEAHDAASNLSAMFEQTNVDTDELRLAAMRVEESCVACHSRFRGVE